MKRDRPTEGTIEDESPEAKRARADVPPEVAAITPWHGPTGLLETELPGEMRDRVLAQFTPKRLGLYEQANSWYQTPPGVRILNQLWRLRTLYDFRQKFADEEGLEPGSVQAAYRIARNMEWISHHLVVDGEEGVGVNQTLHDMERAWEQEGLARIYYTADPDLPEGRTLRDIVVRTTQGEVRDSDAALDIAITAPLIAFRIRHLRELLPRYREVREFWKIAYQHCSNAVAGVCLAVISGLMSRLKPAHIEWPPPRSFGPTWATLMWEMGHVVDATGASHNLMYVQSSALDPSASVGALSSATALADGNSGALASTLQPRATFIIRIGANWNPIRDDTQRIHRWRERFDLAEGDDAFAVAHADWNQHPERMQWAGRWIEFHFHPGHGGLPPLSMGKSTVDESLRVTLKSTVDGKTMARFRLVVPNPPPAYSGEDPVFPSESNGWRLPILRIGLQLEAIDMDRVAAFLHGNMQWQLPSISQLLYTDDEHSVGLGYTTVSVPGEYRRRYFQHLYRETRLLMQASGGLIASEGAMPRPRYRAPLPRLQVLQLAIEPAEEVFDIGPDDRDPEGFAATLLAGIRSIDAYQGDPLRVARLNHVFAHSKDWAWHLTGQRPAGITEFKYVRFLSLAPTSDNTRVHINPLTRTLTYM